MGVVSCWSPSHGDIALCCFRCVGVSSVVMLWSRRHVVVVVVVVFVLSLYSSLWCPHGVALWCRPCVVLSPWSSSAPLHITSQHITHHPHLHQGNMQVESAVLHTRYVFRFVFHCFPDKKRGHVETRNPGIETPKSQR